MSDAFTAVLLEKVLSTNIQTNKQYNFIDIDYDFLIGQKRLCKRFYYAGINLLFNFEIN